MGTRTIYLALGYVLLPGLFLLGCGAEEAQPPSGMDYAANANRWVAEEFQPSTLSRDEQLAELAWFTSAAEPFRGISINVVSETLTTHEYESDELLILRRGRKC